MRTSSRPGLLCRALAGLYTACLGLALTSSAHAGPLPEFTGYTRPGNPASEFKDDKIVPLAKDAKGVGVTVYYTVLDQRGAGSRGVAGDVFGTGVKDFDSLFVAGRELDRGRFDTGARYLYLYQVVNDSGREAAVKSVSVRLIIDPRLITSWGFFAERRKTDKGAVVRRGLGFTADLIRPISTDFAPVTDRRYLSTAPAIRADKTYGFTPIALGERPAAAGEDAGKEPESVYVVSNAYFGEDVSSPYLRPGLAGDADMMPGMEEGRGRGRMVDQWRSRFPAVRAVWSDEDAVRPRERSTVWGFTSDYPPTLEIAAVSSRMISIGDGKAVPAIGDDKKDDKKSPPKKDGDVPALAAGGALDLTRTGLPIATGTLPTPVPPARSVTAAPVESIPMATTLGPALGGGLGAQPGGGVGGGGALGVGGGGAPFLAARGSGAGGGIGGGSGSGGATGVASGSGSFTGTGVSDTTGQQGTGQDQKQGTTLNNTVNVNVRQEQQQQQHQHQHQSQSSGCCPPNGTVVPAPPAWLLGLLGLPVFAALARRRKAKQAAAASQTPTVEPPVA